MLHLFNENLFFSERVKTFTKKILGRENRGPRAVMDSLARGLNELKADFTINSKNFPLDVACVVSGSAVLSWAVRQKQKGLIKKIVAGPNIVVFPGDDGGILRNPLVDIVVVPSKWVQEKYVILAPDLAAKIRIWPAGVVIPEELKKNKETDFLIYNKIGREKLFLEIASFLKQAGYKCEIFHYGKFKQAQYFTALDRTRFEIYLSNSESQGLAMFEAWARGVPTIVWDRGWYGYRNFKMESKNISSPYLSQSAGATFKDFYDFKHTLPRFLSTVFAPRSYVETNFSDAVCAGKYLNIIGNLQ